MRKKGNERRDGKSKREAGACRDDAAMQTVDRVNVCVAEAAVALQM